jgi:SAM-dependent methyltransferase
VLEIGSGGGYFLQKLSGKRGLKLCGLELNTAAVEESVKKGLNVMNATIEEFARKNPSGLDIVCALQVFEHIADINSFLTSCIQALKVGGKLILCVPNNNPYLYKHDFFHTLNLPPHHSGLWNHEAFSSLPRFFPLKLKSAHIEPLTDYTIWYLTQINFLKQKRNPLYRLLSIVPRPLYKSLLFACRHFIEGRNILVEFIKT